MPFTRVPEWVGTKKNGGRVKGDESIDRLIERGISRVPSDYHYPNERARDSSETDRKKKK